jgi:hypothetical protein
VIVIKKDQSKRIFYKCEQPWHCKTDCPNLKKKDKRKASKSGSMGRRAYIVYENKSESSPYEGSLMRTKK